MKVKDLRALLAKLKDDDEVLVAATPDQTGYTNDILPFLGSETGGPGAYILGLKEETVGDGEELDIGWPQRPI